MANATSKAAVFRTIAHARRSAKRFQTNRQIPSETLRDVLKSTIRSPSSFNLMPSQIILVQDQIVKDELAQQAMLGLGNQFRTKDCSALAVFLADLEAGNRIPRIYQLEQEWGKRHANYMAMMPLSTSFLLGEGHAATALKQVSTNLLSNYLRAMPQIEPIQAWSYKNTALLIQSYVLAATSHDLATSLMEGYDARRVKEILRIPDRYDIPMVAATGYEYQDNDNAVSSEEEDVMTPRLNLEEVVFEDSFGIPWSGSEEEDDGDGGEPEPEEDEDEENRAASA